jgi:hypothetical protein
MHASHECLVLLCNSTCEAKGKIQYPKTIQLSGAPEPQAIRFIPSSVQIGGIFLEPINPLHTQRKNFSLVPKKMLAI